LTPHDAAKSLTRGQSFQVRRTRYGVSKDEYGGRDAVNFDYSDDQKFLKDEARKFLGRWSAAC
jgi:hypothetical protein